MNFEIIDTTWCTTLKIDCLKKEGIQTVIRYYSKENSCQFPQKQLGLDEAFALIASNINIVAVFQNENENLEDLNYEKGYADGKFSFYWASEIIGQPFDSAIYFSVNFNAFNIDLQNYIIPYFKGIKQAFHDARTNEESTYRIGVYGSGLVINALKDQGICQYVWLSMNSNFNGTQEALEENKFDLRQVYTPVNKLCELEVNYNLQNPSVQNIGAFRMKTILI